MRRSQATRAPDGGEVVAKRVDRLPLPEEMKQSLFGLGISKLFDIQVKVFQPIMQGSNVVGRSRTGTGKTLAYVLPMLERMRQQKMTAPHSVLILVPTRELCKQVGSMILSLAATTDLALVYSDAANRTQDQQVQLGPRVIIATPGRTLGLVQNGILKAKNVRVLVVDEADAMLGLDYIARVEKVLTAVSKPGLQAVLMSASIPPEMLTVVSRHFPDYEMVDMVDRGGARSTASVEAVQHRICQVSQAGGERERLLLHILEQRLDELGGRAIIFVDSVAEAKVLVTHPVLQRKARALHGDSTMKERDTVLTSFANGEFDVLITTDIVSRGVDFKDVALVLMARPPRDATQYIHRAGRTGRAGQGGMCITLYDATENRFLQRVRDLTRQKFLKESPPGLEDMHYAATSRLLDELLAVPQEEYDPVMKHAKVLLQEQGPHVLATAMAVLDGRRVNLEALTREPPSLLSGRRGFVCFHAHDPNHATAPTEHDCRRVVQSLLPQSADEGSIGKIVGTSQGWAVDIARRFVQNLQDDIRTGRKSAPFEFIVADRLPRLRRVSLRKARRLPWASMQRMARKGRAQTLRVGQSQRQQPQQQP